MKAKLIYMTLIGLFVSCGISNAMQQQFSQLSLTDGKEQDNRMTTYTGNSQLSSSSQGGGTRFLTDEKIDTSNMHKTIINIAKKLSPTDMVVIQGTAAYAGNNLYGLPHFMEYMSACVERYQPGMDLSGEKEIIISGEDSIQLAAFAKYAPKNLFYTYFKPDDIKLLTPEFRKFKDSREKPFGSFNYEDNTIMFAMLYYSGDVEIENTYYKYNNLKFTFSPCPEQQKTAGKKVEDFAFNPTDFSYDSLVKLHPNAKDTLVRSLSSGYSNNDATYQYTAFKLEDGLFRLNVKLSSVEKSNSGYGYNTASEKFEDRKITNFLLSIK